MARLLVYSFQLRLTGGHPAHRLKQIFDAEQSSESAIRQDNLNVVIVETLWIDPDKWRFCQQRL
jgi:hypothetical protein